MNDFISDQFLKEIEHIQKQEMDSRIPNINNDNNLENFAECVDYNNKMIDIKLNTDIITTFNNKYLLPHEDLVKFVKHIALHEYGHTKLGESKIEKTNFNDYEITNLYHRVNYCDYRLLLESFNEFFAEDYVIDNGAEFVQGYIDYKIKIIGAGLNEIFQNKNSINDFIKKSFKIIEWVNSFYLFSMCQTLEQKLSNNFNKIICVVFFICRKFQKIIKKNKDFNSVKLALIKLAPKLEKKLTNFYFQIFPFSDNDEWF